MEGTKPSVSDRLPCWGRWLGGSWGRLSGEQREEKGAVGLPRLLHAPHPTPSVKAGGLWETGPLWGGGRGSPSSTQAGPSLEARGLQEGFLGEDKTLQE